MRERDCAECASELDLAVVVATGVREGEQAGTQRERLDLTTLQSRLPLATRWLILSSLLLTRIALWLEAPVVFALTYDLFLRDAGRLTARR